MCYLYTYVQADPGSKLTAKADKTSESRRVRVYNLAVIDY
jgi:hypothetical protein